MPNKRSDEKKCNVIIRMSEEERHALKLFALQKRTTIQALLMNLIEKEFEKEGVEFGK